MLLIGANWSDICKAPLAIGMGTRSFGEAWAFRDGTDSENLSKDESYLACEDFFKNLANFGPLRFWHVGLDTQTCVWGQSLAHGSDSYGAD